MAYKAYKCAIEEKKHQQSLKKAQMKIEKLERAEQSAVAKEARETNAEIARIPRIDHRLFTECLFG